MKNTHTINWLLIKNMGYIPAFLIGLSTESYMILTVFMFADLVLGILRSTLLHGFTSIKSYKLTAGLISKLLVLAVPLIVVWAGRGASFDFTWLGQWSIGVLVLSQAYSMLGHINAIRTGQDTSEADGVSWVIRRLRSILEGIIIDGHNKEKP